MNVFDLAVCFILSVVDEELASVVFMQSYVDPKVTGKADNAAVTVVFDELF